MDGPPARARSVTARRCLEHLALGHGAELELRHGRSGRPEHRYRWTG